MRKSRYNDDLAILIINILLYIVEVNMMLSIYYYIL